MKRTNKMAAGWLGCCGGASARCSAQSFAQDAAAGGGAAAAATARRRQRRLRVQVRRRPAQRGRLRPERRDDSRSPGPGAHHAHSPAHVVRAGDAQVGREHLSYARFAHARDRRAEGIRWTARARRRSRSRSRCIRAISSFGATRSRRTSSRSARTRAAICAWTTSSPRACTRSSRSRRPRTSR